MAAGELYGASKNMYKDMSAGQLRHFAKTKHKGLPVEKALVGMNTQGTTTSTGRPLPKACVSMEDAGQAIVDRLLAEEGDGIGADNEAAEVSSAQTILSAVNRLQTSLATASPDQTHDLTTIRAAANTLIRMHKDTEQPLDRKFFAALDPTR